MKPKIHHIAVGAGALLLVGLGYSLYRSGNKLDYFPFARIQGIDIRFLTLAVDLFIQNPTTNALSIRIPSVRLLVKGRHLGSSVSTNRVVKITPGESWIRNMLIKIPLLNLTGVFAALGEMIAKGREGLELEVETDTIVYPLALPLSFRKLVKLKNPFKNGSNR